MAWTTKWANPNVTSGNGNATVTWTAASANTGRKARTFTASFNASGVASQTLTVNQAGKTEFVDIANTASVAKAGGSITISGTSNSKKLTFSLTGTNGIGLTLPASYTANSVSTSNGANISGDPGESQEYNFSITFTGIGENTGTSAKTSQLTVTDNGGHTDTCTITQAASDASLSISPSTITLAAAAGSTATVTVISNTSWDIS